MLNWTSALVIFILYFGQGLCYSQNRNSYWCFGDSSGIDFSNGSAQNFVSAIDSRGTCASIADEGGNLLFYCGTRAGFGNLSGLVWNREHQIMMNGDFIIGGGWYNEMLILPVPQDTNRYYLISNCASPTFNGLFFSLIDMQLDSGRGGVTLKNIQFSYFHPWDAMAAVKHGNGRDWWLITRELVDTILSGGNRFHIFQITPFGISERVEAIGPNRFGEFGNLTFSSDGNRLLFTTWGGLIALFDFDRCTGDLSNLVIVDQQFSSDLAYFGSCFSSNGERIYLSTNSEESYLYQYDLTAPIIRNTQFLLDTINECPYPGGQLRLAPDGKVYWSSIWYNGAQFPYPYQDTMYHPVNTHLSVINNPDALGAACNYVRYGHYLGGTRTYLGLPNNPDYSLGPVAGSICDSLTTSVTALPLQEAALHLFYHPDWQQLFVNASGLKGGQGQLQLYSTTGALLLTEAITIQPPYYTRQLDLSKLARGVYILVLQTATERLSGRFVKP